MKLWSGDTSGSWLVYPGTVMVTRARGQWAGPGRPEGTPILIVFPDELTDEEIDDVDGAFLRACTVTPFRRRSGWVFAHRLARRVAAAKDGMRGVDFALKGRGHELGRINTGPVTFGRDVRGLQWLADEIISATQPHSGYFVTDAAQCHAAARRRWLRERHATAANRRQENLRRGAEMLREHFGGDLPRGERACFAFLMDHLHQEVWAEIGASALCELFYGSGPDAPVGEPGA